MQENWLTYPPVAFIVVLFACWLLSHLFKRLAFRPKKHTTGSGQGQSYACGENNYDPMAQPDYTNFFPFAFFFTLAHVATLIMTTVPAENLGTFIMVGIYLLGAVLGLYILFRK